MNAARKLPPLVPFPAVASGEQAALMFVRADAPFRDLWEEAESRLTWIRDLADVAACVSWDGSGSPDRALQAFAAVVERLTHEALVFHGLSYEAAKRERAAGGEA